MFFKVFSRCGGRGKRVDESWAFGKLCFFKKCGLKDERKFLKDLSWKKLGMEGRGGKMVDENWH